MQGEPLRFIRGHVGYLKRREMLTDDLWREDDRGFTTPCWIWKGPPQNKAGYCRVWLRGRQALAHRAMYEQEVGPIPPGMEIDHLCRQTSCVNPSHLESVTRTVNARRGSNTRLTDDDVAEIRASSDKQRVLALRFGVTRSYIAMIKCGRARVD